MKPELNLSWVHSERIGYGRLGVKLNEFLQQIGVDVHDGQPGPKYPDTKPCNVTCTVSTPSHVEGFYRGQYPVMFTMFESTRLPEAFREAFSSFPLMLVPSYQNVELFSQYHENVKFVPLGVDPSEWHYVPRTDPSRYFRFLIGGSGARKGTDLAHKAFRRLFGDGDWKGSGPEPILVMKNPRGEDFYGPRVEVNAGYVSPEEEQAIYEQAHCYLQPSRGEGFGLQPLQAMAQGIPTILTAAHGHESFAHMGYGLDSQMVQSEYFIFGDAGLWWEPDFDQLCEYMEYVYQNWEAAAALAEKNAQVVADEWTWKQTAEKFCAAIGEDLLTTPFNGDTYWVAPELRKYRVRVNQFWSADMCGLHRQFTPGVDYWESSDVKRILFEAGKLDPDCIVNEDGGLLPSQVAKLDEYEATHGWCQMCGQPINPNMLTKAQVRLAELELAHAEKVAEHPELAERIEVAPERPWLKGGTDPSDVWEQYKFYSGSVAFDIGANGGEVSKILAGRFGLVVAVEPAAESFLRLSGTSGGNVQCMNVAVSDHTGEVTLGIASQSIKMGQLVDLDTPEMASWGQMTGTRVVQCYTIDDLAAMHGDPDFIKIDTEGHELQIVKGGLDTIRRCRPRLLIEIHDGYNGQEIGALLSDMYEFEVYHHEASMGLDKFNHYWLISKKPREPITHSLEVGGSMAPTGGV